MSDEAEDRWFLIGLALAACTLLLLLTDCAGSKADLDFRSKVQSSTTDLKITPSADGETVGGELEETITFRDPNAKSAVKPDPKSVKPLQK